MTRFHPRPLAAVLLTLLFALAGAAPAGGAAAAPPVDFRLRTTDGGEISSEMMRGDVVVLSFGSSGLGPLSRAQVQGVQELADQYADRNVRVYWVSTDSDSPKSKSYMTDEQLRAFARKNGLKLAVLRDPDGAFFKQLGVPGNQLPATVILDRTGNVAGEPNAGLDPRTKLADVLAPRLNQLLTQQ